MCECVCVCVCVFSLLALTHHSPCPVDVAQRSTDVSGIQMIVYEGATVDSGGAAADTNGQSERPLSLTCPCCVCWGHTVQFTFTFTLFEQSFPLYKAVFLPGRSKYMIHDWCRAQLPEDTDWVHSVPVIPMGVGLFCLFHNVLTRQARSCFFLVQYKTKVFLVVLACL